MLSRPFTLTPEQLALSLQRQRNREQREKAATNSIPSPSVLLFNRNWLKVADPPVAASGSGTRSCELAVIRFTHINMLMSWVRAVDAST